MVAYSFKAQFEEPIATGAKTQTVRGNRARHARPGEALQLYVAMRTRHCRKILTPDPLCIDVRSIEIVVATYHPTIIKQIEIEGIPLSLEEMALFAIADGFGCEKPGACPLFRMGRFWLSTHGEGTFDGVVIRWEPR